MLTLRRSILEYIAISTFFLFFATSSPCQQDPPPPATSPDPPAAMEPGESSISTRQLIPNILRDQKPIFLFPRQLVQGKHLKPALAIAAATAVLVVLDPYDEPYFRNSSGFSTYKTGPLRARNTTLGMTLVPVGFYLGGLAGKDRYAKNTGLLAAEAIADTQILSYAMKAVDGRMFPSDVPIGGSFRDTWFKHTGPWNNPGSFPSGHAISAFGVATVFAERYRHHRWVPWVSYGLASLVSLSRIPDQAHFPSDVFAGAALGFVVTHYVVLRDDRRGNSDR